MNRTSVALHIVPSDVEYYNLENYDEVRLGSVKSNTREIKVNKTDDGFSIIYDGDTFNQLNASVFGSNMIKIFQANLPNTVIDMKIVYYFELNNGEDEFESVVATKVIEMDLTLLSMNSQFFRYHRSESVVETAEYLREENDPENDFDEDDMFGLKEYFAERGESYEDEDEEEDDPFDFLDRSFKKKSKGRIKMDSYGRSKIMKNAKNPKKSYRRHGILIADSKDDIKRDERILKEFLKAFIPGSSDWKKDLRRDVLKRWMRMYALSKKNLKQLEKEHRRSKGYNNSNGIRTDKALEFTRRLFNVPIDNWSDPNK